MQTPGWSSIPSGFCAPRSRRPRRRSSTGPVGQPGPGRCPTIATTPGAWPTSRSTSVRPTPRRISRSSDGSSVGFTAPGARVTMSPDQHLIVVAPHPDDETLGLGGTIHDHLQNAGSAEIIAVPDGEAADDMAGREARAELARRRQQERRAALALLGAAGVRVTSLRFADRDVVLHQPPLP